MSSNTAETTTDNTTPTKETFAQKTARWIDDPVASVVAGIIFPTVAVGVVLSGIFGLGLVH